MVGRDHAFGGACVYFRPVVQKRKWLSQFPRHPVRTAKHVLSYYCSPMQFRAAAAWRKIARCAVFDDSLRIGPNATCSNYLGKDRNQEIRFGPDTILRGVVRVDAGGQVTVGSDVYIGDDSIISSACGVTIGNHTLIAHGVHIFDNDSHPLQWSDRVVQNEAYRLGRASGAPAVGKAPVTVGDHVWIGFNAMIFKGVHIGDRSVVAAGSVVTKSVPPDCVVAGNPARVVRSLVAVPGSPEESA